MPTLRCSHRHPDCDVVMAADDQSELMGVIATHESRVHGERPDKWPVAEVDAIKRNIEQDEPG